MTTAIGDVFYMGRQNGSSLAFVDKNSGHAIIKVDNTTFVPFNQKRDSVRLPFFDHILPINVSV